MRSLWVAAKKLISRTADRQPRLQPDSSVAKDVPALEVVPVSPSIEQFQKSWRIIEKHQAPGTPRFDQILDATELSDAQKKKISRVLEDEFREAVARSLTQKGFCTEEAEEVSKAVYDVSCDLKAINYTAFATKRKRDK